MGGKKVEVSRHGMDVTFDGKSLCQLKAQLVLHCLQPKIVTTASICWYSNVFQWLLRLIILYTSKWAERFGMSVKSQWNFSVYNTGFLGIANIGSSIHEVIWGLTDANIASKSSPCLVLGRPSGQTNALPADTYTSLSFYLSYCENGTDRTINGFFNIHVVVFNQQSLQQNIQQNSQ